MSVSGCTSDARQKLLPPQRRKKVPGTVPIILPIVTGSTMAFTAEMTVSRVREVACDFLMTSSGVDALSVPHTEIDNVSDVTTLSESANCISASAMNCLSEPGNSKMSGYHLQIFTYRYTRGGSRGGSLGPKNFYVHIISPFVNVK